MPALSRQQSRSKCAPIRMSVAKSEQHADVVVFPAPFWPEKAEEQRLRNRQAHILDPRRGAVSASEVFGGDAGLRGRSARIG